MAIGELADGLRVELDKVPKKYAGLDGTEIAISESQERMAVVVDPKDVEKFMSYAKEENLEATEVAVVTEDAKTCSCMERKRDCQSFPSVFGYEWSASGNGGRSGNTSSRRKFIC